MATIDSAASTGRRRTGIALVTAGTLLWSLAGFFVRLLDLDVWTVFGWRAFFGALGLLAIVAWRNGGRVDRGLAGLGPVGLLAIPVSAISMFGYIGALTFTDVANVMTIYATIPFVAAGIAFLWLGERPTRRVVVASAISFAGIAAMAASALGPSDIRGNALAFAMTVGFSFLMVLSRRHPHLQMAAINLGAAAICFVIALPLMPAVWPTPVQFLILAVFGLATNALAYVLFLTGGRHIPSGEAGLIALLDVVLGPLWVFLAFGEVPTGAALFAGVVVLGATGWYLSGLASKPPADR
ncbi:DMT family transporter [Aureimonas leprariae]|uniref:DMT family transporter n=1 Tax=Plantimonas leprariae TaxID=2615207 RepID=A0A7V7TVP5_9HYPH|nr:DMT family transporter [Aureimonas leprariae]KAB0678852.1 DMT family transporter [Aureimonas leprariae]